MNRKCSTPFENSVGNYRLYGCIYVSKRKANKPKPNVCGGAVRSRFGGGGRR